MHETPINNKKDGYDDKSIHVKEEKFLSEEKDITGVKKDKFINIVNVDGLDFDDKPIGNKLAPSIAKRLRNRT